MIILLLALFVTIFGFGVFFGLLFKTVRFFYRLYRKSKPPTQIEP